MKKITFLVALLIATVSLTAADINVAEGKTVTVNKGDRQEHITDGTISLGNYWNGKAWAETPGCGSPTEKPEFTVDLGSEQTISSFKLFTYWGDGRTYQYKILTSTNNVDFTLSVDRTTNTVVSNATGIEDTPIAGTETARYIKVITVSRNNGTTGDTHIVELEVQAGGSNVAAGKTVTSPSCYSADRPLSWITDGLTAAGGYWNGHFNVEQPAVGHPQATIDLGEVVEDINKINVITYYGGNRYYQYYVEISEDGTTWEEVMDRRTNTTNSTQAGDEQAIPNKKARYVRITGTYGSANADFHVVEMQVFAPETTTDIVTKEVNNLKVSVSNGMISIAGVESFEVFNVAGKQMNATQPLQAGIYLVKANNLVQKVIVK